MLGRSRRRQGASGEVILTIFCTNDGMLHKASGNIDAELGNTTSTAGVGLDSLMKKHGIYDGLLEDLKNRRPRERWDARDARAKLTIVSLSLQNIDKHHQQEKAQLGCLTHRGHVLAEMGLKTKQRSIAGWRRCFVEVPDLIILCGDWEQGIAWATTLEELATQLELRLHQNSEQKARWTPLNIKGEQLDIFYGEDLGVGR